VWKVFQEAQRNLLRRMRKRGEEEGGRNERGENKN
jgi:hypothetical protein